MRARTNEEKRELAKIMKRDAPDLFDFFVEVGKVFGPAQFVFYNQELKGICCKPGLQKPKNKSGGRK